MLKSAFSSKGLIRRKEYCLTILISSIILVLLLLGQIGVNSIDRDLGKIVALMNIFIILVLIVFLFQKGTKRCHDIGYSGWYQLIPFFGLLMYFKDGQKGDNKYGVNPKELKPNETIIKA